MPEKSPESLNALYVKTKSGVMAPISQFVTLEKNLYLQSVSRYNLFTSVKITGSNAPGYSTETQLEQYRSGRRWTQPKLRSRIYRFVKRRISFWLSNAVDIPLEFGICIFHFSRNMKVISYH